MSDTKPIIVITGPTATGKTALAVELAHALNTEILSADSVQIYKELNIGSAKPTKDEQEGIVHHLMDFLPPDAPYSVANYVSDAKACANGLYEADKIPIMVGGTGLYIESFLKDVDFVEDNVDLDLREKLNRLAEEKGGAYLLDQLRKIDPKTAQKLHESDVRRIVRAIEFYETAHMTKSEHDEATKKAPSPYQSFTYIIDYDRAELYDRINRRVDLMFQNGLEEEVRRLLAKGYSPRNCLSMQGIGYKETVDYINGLSTLDEAKELIKKGSRRYAKRQLTWFRRDKSIVWIPSHVKDRCEFVLKDINEKLYKKKSM